MPGFNNLKLGTRLYIYFGIILALVLMVDTLAVLFFFSNAEKTNQIIIPLIVLANSIAFPARRIIDTQIDYSFTKPKSYFSYQKEAISFSKTLRFKI